MILNPRQIDERIRERARLIGLLRQEEEDVPALVQFVGREDVLSGLQSDWEKLANAQMLRPTPAALPHHGHLFIAAVVEPHPGMLRRLLEHFQVDIEREWELPGFQSAWNAWVWTASTVMNDGAVQESVMHDSWTIILPHLLAAGMDLSLPMKNGEPREHWLARQDVRRFDEAKALADLLRLDWATPVSFNTASRRL